MECEMRKYIAGWLFSLSLISAQHICYSIDKSQIISNLDSPEGVRIAFDNTSLLKNEQNFSVWVEFDTARYIPYAGRGDLQCFQGKKQEDYTCYGDDDGGTIEIKVKGKDVYFKIGMVRLGETTDDPIVYSIKGNVLHYIKGTVTPCKRSLDAIVKAKNFEEDREKTKLAKSLAKLKDIIIYDIDYNEDVAIAVGEDNSVETREKQDSDEYYLPVTLYSFDKGKHWKRSSQGDIPKRRVVMSEGKKAVAVGSVEGAGGYIFLTENGGADWKTVYEGDFLYDIAMHDKSLIAVGYKILKSNDTKRWRAVKSECKELYAVMSLDKKRLVASGNGEICFSKDSGESWHRAKIADEEEALQGIMMEHLYLKGGKLYVWARHPEGFTLVSSDNGEHWKYEE
jgi:hypothetical protein